MEEGGERTKRLNSLKKNIIRRIDFLEHKAVIDYKDVYHLIRNFFREYLEKHYEFTFKELQVELKKVFIPSHVKQDVFGLLSMLEHMEYTTKSFEKKELVKILEEFKKIVEALVKAQNKETGFIAKLKRFIFKEEEEVIILSELPVMENDEPYHVQLNILLEKTYRFLNTGKVSKAQKQYKEVLKFYDDSPKKIKEEFFPIIDLAYKALVECIENKKK